MRGGFLRLGAGIVLISFLSFGTRWGGKRLPVVLFRSPALMWGRGMASIITSVVVLAFFALVGPLPD